MKRILWLGIFLFLISTLAQANLTAEISPQSGTISDTLTLTITDDSLDSQNLPDLTPLQENFAILGTQRSFSYSSVNGKATNISQWTILLRAKKTGALEIPALSFKNGVTHAVSVNIVKDSAVSNADNNLSDNQKEVFLTAEVDNRTPYINQQILYTIKLYNSRRLLDTHYQPPEVENALLVPLGDTRQYQRVENGKAYMVEEQHYAIFPQKSGDLTIIPPSFTALLYDVVPTEIKTQNKPLSLTVKSAPVQDSKSWLPVKEINLTESWDIKTKTLDQGSTLVRTIQIEARGTPAQFLQSLPALNFINQEGYRVYPEKGKQTNIMRDGDLVGKLSMNVTYLLEKPGTVTLPELRLPWFNTATGKEEIAALPPRTFQVQKITDNSSVPAPAALPQEQATPPVTAPSTKEQPHETLSFPLAWILACCFALAWLITVACWFFQKYPGQGKTKKSLHELHKACLTNDPLIARTAVLHWARLRWPDAILLNLNDVIKLVKDLKLKQQLNILSSMLYSQGEKGIWHGETLWRAISDFMKAKPATQKNKSTLPPINPG